MKKEWELTKGRQEDEDKEEGNARCERLIPKRKRLRKEVKEKRRQKMADGKMRCGR